MILEQISPIVNEGLTKMIENYKNGTDDFKATVDQIQENVSSMETFSVHSHVWGNASGLSVLQVTPSVKTSVLLSLYLMDSSAWNSFLKDVAWIHLQLKCCGVNSSSDWSYLDSDGNSVPDSCCINKTKGCGKGSMKNAGTVYQKVIHHTDSTLWTQTEHLKGYKAKGSVISRNFLN